MNKYFQWFDIVEPQSNSENCYVYLLFPSRSLYFYIEINKDDHRINSDNFMHQSWFDNYYKNDLIKPTDSKFELLYEEDRVHIIRKLFSLKGINT